MQQEIIFFRSQNKMIDVLNERQYEDEIFPFELLTWWNDFSIKISVLLQVFHEET